MKQQTEIRLILVFIAACLVFLFLGKYTVQSPETVDEPAAAVSGEPVYFTNTGLHERVIYTCRLGAEKIPAVQISEVTDANGQPTGTTAQVRNETEFDLTARSAAVPKWDYKSISARADETIIDVAFSPQGRVDGNDWILTLADENTSFRKRVRDCAEVSDE
jgi:hypothetical protein